MWCFTSSGLSWRYVLNLLPEASLTKDYKISASLFMKDLSVNCKILSICRAAVVLYCLPHSPLTFAKPVLTYLLTLTSHSAASLTKESKRCCDFRQSLYLSQWPWSARMGRGFFENVKKVQLFKNFSLTV